MLRLKKKNDVVENMKNKLGFKESMKKSLENNVKKKSEDVKSVRCVFFKHKSVEEGF